MGPSLCSEVQYSEDKKMIPLVFYVIVVVKEYSGTFFFLLFSFSFVGSVGRVRRLVS